MSFDLHHGVKTLFFCGEQRVMPWKRERLVFQSLEADEGLEPRAFILCVSTGSGKLCKRGAACVSSLGNIHRAPSDHEITQVCWAFRGIILPTFQTKPHQNVRAEIHPSAVPSHYGTERGRKGTSLLTICGGQGGAGILLQDAKRGTSWMAKRAN